jgi:DNA-binding winged helix-turn-helix (wHTH) protein
VIYIFDNYTLDGNKRELRDREVVIQLQPQVFDLLEFLLRNRDRVVSKDEMLAAVWGGSFRNPRLPAVSMLREAP